MAVVVVEVGEFVDVVAVAAVVVDALLAVGDI